MTRAAFVLSVRGKNISIDRQWMMILIHLGIIIAVLTEITSMILDVFSKTFIKFQHL